MRLTEAQLPTSRLRVPHRKAGGFVADGSLGSEVRKVPNLPWCTRTCLCTSQLERQAGGRRLCFLLGPGLASAQTFVLTLSRPPRGASSGLCTLKCAF